MTTNIGTIRKLGEQKLRAIARKHLDNEGLSGPLIARRFRHDKECYQEPGFQSTFKLKSGPNVKHYIVNVIDCDDDYICEVAGHVTPNAMRKAGWCKPVAGGLIQRKIKHTSFLS